MPKRGRKNPVTAAGILIFGFTEGFVAPIAEGCIAILMSSVVTIAQIASQSTGSQNLDLLSFFAVFGVLSLLENFLFGLLKNGWEMMGYCIGAIFGIYILAKIITAIFPGAILATIYAIIMIILGIGVRIWLLTPNTRRNDNYDYMYR